MEQIPFLSVDNKGERDEESAGLAWMFAFPRTLGKVEVAATPSFLFKKGEQQL